MFSITGLDPASFKHLYGRSDSELAAEGVLRHVADEKPGFPDRVEMRDAELGERLLLLNHMHLPIDTPYRACHAIYVLEGAQIAYHSINEVPSVLRPRALSLRAFDEHGIMIDADLVDGKQVETLIGRLFANPSAAYIHAHNAKRGCFAGLISRA